MDSVDSKFTAMVDSIVFDAIDSLAFPGAQILIAKEGEIIFEKAYGFHTYDQIRPVETNHLYDLASITKVSTGLPLLMNLIAKEYVELDTPISKYIPLLKRSNKANLTLREILAHQSGIKPYIVYWQNTIKDNGSWKRRTFKSKANRKFPIFITDSLYMHKKYRKKMEKSIKRSELLEHKDYKYSGLFFQLLPKLLEDIKEKPFLAILNTELFTPIGATDLAYNPYLTYSKERIVPTEKDSVFRNQLVHGTVHDEAAAMLGGVSCNAGLFGNARSLSKLFQLYLNNGNYNGNQLIDSTILREFTKCQYCDSGNRRGLGFDKPLIEYDEILSSIAKDASKESFGHSGFTGTLAWADPEHNLIFIFLSNRVYPSRTHRKIYQMNVRPKIHQLVYDYYIQNGNE